MLVVVHLVPVQGSVEGADQPAHAGQSRVHLAAEHGPHPQVRAVHQKGMRGDGQIVHPQGEDVSVGKDPFPFPSESGPRYPLRAMCSLTRRNDRSVSSFFKMTSAVSRLC